jgi:transcription initiation factor TFIIIB Brf1 subunit/transcription initiation factor TFIIB
MQEMVNTHTKFSAKDYLRSYGWKLTQDTRMIERAEKLLTTIQRKIGGNPTSLAAAALYFVCKGNNVPLSKEKVGEVFHISGRTVYSNERRISKLLSTTKCV